MKALCGFPRKNLNCLKICVNTSDAQGFCLVKKIKISKLHQQMALTQIHLPDVVESHYKQVQTVLPYYESFSFYGFLKLLQTLLLKFIILKKKTNKECAL